MISKKEISEVRSHLEKAQNPLIYFDNDQDGLCSYLLLRRFYKKGKGIPVKTSPLGKDYFRRINEFDPDYVFILDQPTVSEEFFDSVRKRGIPVVWIDHHTDKNQIVPNDVFYYNSLLSGKKGEPVTKICYDVTKRKEDLWILITGCISDRFLPSEYKVFFKEYPDLSIDSMDPFKILYFSEIGKISRMIGTGLKDRTSSVMKMIKFLINAKTPYDVLEERSANKEMHKRFSEINSKLGMFVKRAGEKLSGNMIFFEYSSDVSMSADIANRLSYDFPGKFIVVARNKGGESVMSLRGKKIKSKFLRAIEGISGARGGGHEDAVGGRIDSDKLNLLKENLEKIINQKT